jgi:DNA-binding PadR family transcriptional regulator
MKHGPPRPGREWRDFWRAWREEQRRIWRESHQDDEPWEPKFPPPPEINDAWREFFYGFMGDWPESHWAFSGRRFKPWHQGQAAFNPFVAGLLSKGGGLLPLIVLHLLAEKARYGNEIMDLIAEQTGGRWVANPGAIYPLLTGLENLGLIVGEWEDPRKRTVRIYRLTQFGEQELDRVKAIVRPKLKEAIEVLEKLARDLDGAEGEGLV